MWKGIAIGVALVVEIALCASAQTPDQSEETKRTLTRHFLDCVTSQVITIDDFTSDVSAIARGAVSLCKAEAHAAANGAGCGTRLSRASRFKENHRDCWNHL